MNNKSGLVMAFAMSSSVLTACSHQQVAPVIPAAVVNPPKVVQVKPMPVLPAPKPYRDVVVKPAPLKPAPMPRPVVRPAPVVKPMPVVVAQPFIKVPPVKAKGTYRGAVPIDNTLRQQYQQ